MSYASNYDELDMNNPAPRCPVALLLDTSYSMAGAAIEELKAALAQFLRETSEDEAAGMSVELSVITFGGTVDVAMPFAAIADVDHETPDLVADGATPMGGAIQMGLDALSRRRQLYQSKGVAAYKPWLVLMTDGEPNDDWQAAAEKARNMANNKKLNLIVVGIGPSANMGILAQISGHQPMKLQGLKFKKFFRWLTDSLRMVTSGTVSNEEKIRTAPINSFADLTGTRM
ncbi:MAG: VWA domain-containing protein [Lentisphaerota bacterium]